MKFPSITALISEAYSTLKRFPLVILSSIALEVFLIIIIDRSIEDLSELNQFAFTASLGISLFFALRMFSERYKLSLVVQTVSSIVILGLLTIYYFLDDIDHVTFMFRFLSIIIGTHLLVALSAYIKVANPEGFWQFNKRLLMRFLTSAFFSLALFAGLSLAIVGTDKLLGVDWDSDIYTHLFAFIGTIFNTWFFLAGIPKSLEEIDKEVNYEKVVRLFAQYVLIPITTIYLVILYVYELKILVDWNLPKGWVSVLIFAYAALGILANLLLFPLIRQEGKKWIKTFSKFFYITLFPLFILLYLALDVRISEYGYTEARYYGVVLLGWLFLIAVYFILSKKKNIKAIPYTLAFLAFTTIIGPWSASSVTVSSQKGKLLAMFEEFEIFEDGKVREGIELSSEDYSRFNDQIRFLEQRGEYPWVIEKINDLGNLELDKDSTSSYTLDESLGFIKINQKTRTTGKYLGQMESAWQINENTSIYNFNFSYSASKEHSSTVYHGDNSAKIIVNKTAKTVVIEFENGKEIKFDFKEIVKEYNSDYGSNPNKSNKMILQQENSMAYVYILLNEIQGNDKEEEIKLQIANGFVIIDWKK
jgi:hypothetical protein